MPARDERSTPPAHPPPSLSLQGGERARADAASCHGQSADAPVPAEVLVARQPIFAADGELYAYELLFRGSGHTDHAANDDDAASYYTINGAIHLIGWSVLTGGHRAFVNFTRQLLLEDAYTLLPRHGSVIEVLEGVVPDRPIVKACARIKEAGYMVALDDVVLADASHPLLALADIIKVDFLQARPAQRRDLAMLCRRRGILALAEKVETHQQAEEARADGYAYLQGYFFCRPQLRSSRDLRPIHQAHLQFLAQITAEEIDLDQLERIIRSDPSLTYKLLRYINSAAFGMPRQIVSVHQALTLLGARRLRRWGGLVALTGLAQEHCPELVRRCLARARFCERMGELIGDKGAAPSLFMLGLLSGLHTVLARPMHEVVADLPVSDEFRRTLLGESTAISDIPRLARACERGHWQRATALGAKLQIAPADLARTQHEALAWTDNLWQADQAA